MRRIALFAALFFAVSAFGQLPPGKWWRRPDVIQNLNLTDEQQDRLERIFRGAATDLIDLRAEVEKSNIALRGELDRPQLDPAAIHKVAMRLNEARGKLFVRELSMLVEMRSVLNDQQWNRMRNMLEKLERPPQQRPNQRPNQ